MFMTVRILINSYLNGLHLNRFNTLLPTKQIEQKTLVNKSILHSKNFTNSKYIQNKLLNSYIISLKFPWALSIWQHKMKKKLKRINFKIVGDFTFSSIKLLKINSLSFQDKVKILFGL